MSINERPALSPEMLLFEIAAMCSRHGVPVHTNNPGAARHLAAQLMRALGIVPDEPAAIAPPPPRPPAPVSRSVSFDVNVPTSHLPVVDTRRPGRGTHRVQRPLSIIPGVPDGIG